MVGSTIAKFTIDEYHRIVDAGVLVDRDVELLEGLIVEMVPEGIPHAYLSDESGDYLSAVLGYRAKVREGKPITLSDSEPEPDLAIVQPLGAEYAIHHPYADNVFWVIEFSDSSLAKDLGDKLKVYAAAGIPEYWVVNLRDNELIVFRSPHNGTYQTETRLRDGNISPLAFPEIVLSVSRLMG